MLRKWCKSVFHVQNQIAIVKCGETSAMEASPPIFIRFVELELLFSKKSDSFVYCLPYAFRDGDKNHFLLSSTFFYGVWWREKRTVSALTQFSCHVLGFLRNETLMALAKALCRGLGHSSLLLWYSNHFDFTFSFISPPRVKASPRRLSICIVYLLARLIAVQLFRFAINGTYMFYVAALFSVSMPNPR